MNAKKINYLKVMGIDTWSLKSAPAKVRPLFMVIKKAGESATASETLVDAMFKAINIPNESLYFVTLTNTPNEWNTLLEKEIEKVQPKNILVLGESIATHLASSNHFYVTHSPAHLLKNPKDKKKTFEDLQHAVADILLSSELR